MDFVAELRRKEENTGKCFYDWKLGSGKIETELLGRVPADLRFSSLTFTGAKVVPEKNPQSSQQAPPSLNYAKLHLVL